MCGQTGAGRQVITIAHSEPLAKRRLREREREREKEREDSWFCLFIANVLPWIAVPNVEHEQEQGLRANTCESNLHI